MPANRFRTLCVELGGKYNVSPILLEAMIHVESRGTETARGKAGEIGLLQLLPSGALAEYEQRIKMPVSDPFDAHTNILVGAWYLGVRIPEMFRKFGIPDSLENRIMAYNCGVGNLLHQRIPQTTKDYLRDVKSYMSQFVPGSRAEALATAPDGVGGASASVLGKLIPAAGFGLLLVALIKAWRALHAS
jgi:hypothetical protein